MTSFNMEGTMVSDLGTPEIYILPRDIGEEMKELLQLEQTYSEESTLEAFNAYEKGRMCITTEETIFWISRLSSKLER